jgi:hypothetical protein
MRAPSVAKVREMIRNGTSKKETSERLARPSKIVPATSEAVAAHGAQARVRDLIPVYVTTPRRARVGRCRVPP